MSMCLDSYQSFLIYGGKLEDGDLFGDVWRFNLTSKKWNFIWGTKTSNRQPQLSGLNKSPGGLNFGTIVVDTPDSFVLYGGNTDDGAVDQVWKFTTSSNQWELLSGSDTFNGAQNMSTPGSRSGHVILLEEYSNSFVLFGGQGNTTNGFFNDVWRFSLDDLVWTHLVGNLSTSNNFVADYDRYPGGVGFHSAAFLNPTELITFGGEEKYNNALESSNRVWLLEFEKPVFPSTTSSEGSVSTQSSSPEDSFSDTPKDTSSDNPIESSNSIASTETTESAEDDNLIIVDDDLVLEDTDYDNITLINSTMEGNDVDLSIDSIDSFNSTIIYTGSTVNIVDDMKLSESTLTIENSNVEVNGNVHLIESIINGNGGKLLITGCLNAGEDSEIVIDASKYESGEVFMEFGCMTGNITVTYTNVPDSCTPETAQDDVSLAMIFNCDQGTTKWWIITIVALAVVLVLVSIVVLIRINMLNQEKEMENLAVSMNNA
eukprot:TRINITY_DN4455_c0_g1_i3.p1 TRINITY_DN4455_c0_g1~~TRINITY_DN4455_c0_g1_i3.p1  ORF type:complete len:487 (-),score=117.04 TRINITY_DN4455_c0_g1_i3:71-1531(-)